MQRQIRKRTRYRDQQERAQELLNATDPPPNAAAIRRILEREYELVPVPDERTIRNWIHDGAISIEPDYSPWTYLDAQEPEDIRLVLDVVDQVVLDVVDQFNPWWPTVAQGRWIARLCRAYPAIVPGLAYQLIQLRSTTD